MSKTISSLTAEQRRVMGISEPNFAEVFRWPLQRNRAKKPKMSAAEREYRERVRRNKSLAAATERNAKYVAQREALRVLRGRNLDAVRRNELAIQALESERNARLVQIREKRRQRRILAARRAIRAGSQRRALQRAIATPKWANRGAMLNFYKEAKRVTADTGVQHAVDHIVPLQSSLVCGLHCEANMQVLTGVANSVKSNCFWPDMP